VLPVAILHETELEHLVGKKYAEVMLAAYYEDVLSILLREEKILLAFAAAAAAAAGSSIELFAELMFRGDRYRYRIRMCMLLHHILARATNRQTKLHGNETFEE